MEILNLDLELSPDLIQELADFVMREEYRFPPDGADCPYSPTNKEDKLYSTWTPNNGLVKFPESIEDWYRKKVRSVTIKLGLYGRSEVENVMWCQIYTNKTDGHPVHTHYCGEELFSWVHFVKAPTDQKCFYFVDSNSNKIYPEDQSSGRFLVFPSWAMHGVDAVESCEEPRIVVAGNVLAKKYKIHPFESNTYVISRSKRGDISWNITADNYDSNY